MNKKLIVWFILSIYMYGFTDINISVIRVSASCEKIYTQKAFTYRQWAGICPAYNSSQALSFLEYHDITQPTLPSCMEPMNITPALGTTLSQDIPNGYELYSESNISFSQQSYDGYGKISSNSGNPNAGVQGISPLATGIRTNTRITSGFCRGLSAGISFESDVYAGVIRYETFTQIYRKTCDLNNTEFKQADNEKILFSWTEYDANLGQSCLDKQGSILTRLVSCQKQYQCVKKTENCPIERNEQVGSYVSPRNGTFHEDIEVTGADFGLHYNSAEWNSTSIAHGWSISSHASLEGNKMHLGSGSLYAIGQSTQEGNLTVLTYGSNEYLFHANGQAQSIRDLYTKVTKTTFGYDTMGRLLTVTDIYGEISTVERDSNGIATAIVAPTGQRTLLKVDTQGDLIEVQYEDTSSYAFEYEKHLMTKETEPNGNSFLHFFDEQGKVVKVIDAEQGEWNFASSSDSTFGTHKVTRASGDVVTYKNHFLENGMLKSEKTLPTGDVVTYSNNIDESSSSSTTCGTNTTNIYRKNADGTLYQNPYTQRRELESQSITMPSGLNKLSSFTTTFSYKRDGTLRRIDKQSSTNSKTSLDRKNLKRHRTVSISPLGKRFVLQYDSQWKNLLWSKSYGLVKTEYSYDAQGRVIEEKRGRRVSTYSYNARGKLESITDPLGRSTSYSYDNRDRLIQITYADGTQEHFTYDANSNLVIRTIPTPADHSFTYNGVNKRVSNTSPLQKQTIYSYDKQRRVIKVTKPSAKSIETKYVKGRVSSITTPEGITNYAYACQNNVSSVSKGSESFTYTYDGTLLSNITQAGQVNQSLSYTYNNDFLLDSMTYANQREKYSYNQDNQPTQIASFSIVRTNKDRNISITDGSYKKVTLFNRQGELRQKEDNVLNIELRRNTLGQIRRKIETLANKRTSYRYSYDERARLIQVRQGRNIVEIYTYDKNGNRASAIVHGTSISASYTLDDNLVVYGDNTYLYDADGYLKTKTTPDGSTTYSYGTMGELLSVTTPTQSITYQQNANNQRVSKSIDGQVVEKYLWANLTTLLAIYDSNDNLVQRFEYADSRMPVAMTQGATKYYLHYDQVGSLRVVTDSSHNIVKEILYDTYGNIISDINEAFKVPFGFAGGLYDSDTKLTRFGYRDYDATTGKWTAKDPIGFSGGDSNLYGYVLGDPVNWIDVDGLARGKNGGDGSSTGRGTNNKYKHCREISATQIKCKNKKDGNWGRPRPKPDDWDDYKKSIHCDTTTPPLFNVPTLTPPPWWHYLPLLIPIVGPILAP